MLHFAMPVPLLKSPDTLQVGVLNCDVEERDDAKKESFSLLWEDLTVEERRQERTTLLEWNRARRERSLKMDISAEVPKPGIRTQNWIAVLLYVDHEARREEEGSGELGAWDT